MLTNDGINLTSGKTKLRSYWAAKNQGEFKWWCAMRLKCLHEPTGALASFKKSPARRTLHVIELEGNPIKICTAALGARPPTSNRRLHHFRSLLWKAEKAASGWENSSMP